MSGCSGKRGNKRTGLACALVVSGNELGELQGRRELSISSSVCLTSCDVSVESIGRGLFKLADDVARSINPEDIGVNGVGGPWQCEVDRRVRPTQCTTRNAPLLQHVAV